ncbi:hypothetical protein DZG01_17770 [Pseudomonas fluorescens]|nr:hypothetical protein DZG01_17770 [Pseudomonas fluorescens]
MAAPRKTLAEYLQWAALKPRTSGWSALVAYDRNKCNQLLLQKYIEKHDQHSLMPPINEAYGSSEFTWHWLLDYVTDAPRLSFENDPDGQKAEVNMSMAIVGGKNISLDDADGFARVNSISSFDPLDHPTLQVEGVELKDIQGSVTEDCEVLLDLGDPDYQGYNWAVTGNHLEHERLAAGAFFKRKFSEAELARRTFSLGTLAQTNQAFMKPQSFKLRAIMEEGAASRGNQNYGNGAIEMRIAMDDEQQGGAPGEDWLYPFPSDRPDIDALTILGTHFFMHGVIGKGTARAFNVPAARFDSRTDAKGFVEWLGVRQVSGGYLEVPPLEVSVNGKTLTFLNYRIPIYINQDHRLTMSLYRAPGGLPRLAVGMGAVSSNSPIVCKVNGLPYSCRLGFGLSSIYNFSLDPTSRRLDVNLKSFDAYADFLPNPLLPLGVADYMRSNAFATSLGNLVALKTMGIFNGLDEIDLFTLNTLYFNAENAVHLKTADLTGEMILFGSISPRLTTFAIDPVQVMLTHGQTHPFETVPPTPGVTWRVEDLDGNTEGVGRMNESTGQYTAPALADIQGTYKRVKVIATGSGTGNDRHVSKALVTVVARAITLNPLVEVCNGSEAGKPEESRKLSAHSMGGGLRWRVEGGGHINETADENGENTYYAPLKHAAPGPSFSLDKIIVTDTTTHQEQTTLMVLKHFVSAIVISTDFEGMPANQVKLICKLSGVIPPEPPIWACIPEDAGTLDQNTGVFTAGQTTNSQFALITVRIDLGGMQFDGFTILPIPLASLASKPAPEMLSQQTTRSSTAGADATCPYNLPIHPLRSASPFIS